MIILDLRQYPTASDGTPVGRHVLVSPRNPVAVRQAYMFTNRPDLVKLTRRANALADVAAAEVKLREADAVMVGGPCYFIRHLEDALLARGLIPVHPYRDSQGTISGVVHCGGES